MVHANKIATVCLPLMLALCLACGDDPHETGSDPAPAIAGGGGSDQPTRYDDEVALVVRNQTSRTVHGLYVSPSTSESWGPDQLGGAELPPGFEITLYSDYCDAYYDLEALDRAGNVIARADRLFFGCGKRETVTLH